jgi:hypothetical protein
MERMTIPPGNKHAISLNLGTDVPLGGSLVVDLCRASFDTQLFVSAWFGALGCPSATNAALWACTSVSDDDCGVQSVVKLDALATRQVYIVFGGYNGLVGAYDLRWNYTAPDVSPTARATSAGPRSRSATSTHTVGVSRSGTATLTGTASTTADPTITPARTGSAPSTPAPTATATSTQFSCGTRPDDVAVTARVSGSSGRFNGTTAGCCDALPVRQLPADDE